MKYALSSRQTAEYLQKADEIRVQYRDRDIIYDFVDEYPDKTIILEIPFYIEEEKIDYQLLTNFNKLVPNFICRISRPSDIIQLRELNIKWYYGMIVDKWEDLTLLASMEPEYVLVGGDLFFDLPKVVKFGIPVRAVPNVASISPLMLSDELDYDISIVGDWFPPDAMSVYEDYISVIEFENCSLQQERALYRIYNQASWPGDLTTIITNLKTKVEGRLINPEWFSAQRLNCGRKCLAARNAGCQICYRHFSLANYEKLKEYKEEVLDKELTD